MSIDPVTMEHLLATENAQSSRLAGVIPLHEVGRGPLNVGEHVVAVVTQAEGPDGGVVLSPRRVRNRQHWMQVEEMKKNRTVVEATVLEANRGVVVDGGVRGFVPLSQIVSIEPIAVDQAPGCGSLGAVRQPTRYRSDR